MRSWRVIASTYEACWMGLVLLEAWIYPIFVTILQDEHNCYSHFTEVKIEERGPYSHCWIHRLISSKTVKSLTSDSMPGTSVIYHLSHEKRLREVSKPGFIYLLKANLIFPHVSSKTYEPADIFCSPEIFMILSTLNARSWSTLAPLTLMESVLQLITSYMRCYKL